MNIAPSPLLRWTKENREGGILVTTLLIIALMSMLTAATLYRVSSRYAATYQSVCWQEALSSAEAGADLALLSLNKSLTSPGTAWAAWTPSDATTFPKTYVPAIPNHSGEGNTKVFSKIVVDNGVGGGWYRVRSTGVAELPERSINGIEAARADSSGVKNHRSMLRKASFYTDYTAGVLHLPQVARTIEVLAAQSASHPYIRALTVKQNIGMSGSAYTDSFDSTNPAYSTNSQYDATKREQHGDIATNVSGNLSDLKNTYVYGNASSNGGTIQNTSNVSGTVTNNFQTTIPDITAPVLSNVQMTPTIIKNSSAVLAAGTAASPKSYILSELTIGGGNVVTITNPTPGQDAYVNIYVTGNNGITVSGSSTIVQQPGVHVTMYAAGQMTFSGGGVLNQNNVASYLQIFGITPSSGTNSLTVSGSAAFIGVLNAPAYAMTISGSAAFIGAAIGNSVNISGGGGFHYDEALSSVSGPGTPASYTYSSWVEDIR